jgi:hypothetical protein
MLLQTNWHLDQSNGYPSNGGGDGKQKTRVHNLLMPGVKTVDHINLNKLDNRRNNLRPCSRSESNCNTSLRRDNRSGFRGVTQIKCGLWRASVKMHGVDHVAGYFKTPEEAASARDAVARKLHGAFARLNFPLPGERPARVAASLLSPIPVQQG